MTKDQVNQGIATYRARQIESQHEGCTGCINFSRLWLVICFLGFILAVSTDNLKETWHAGLVATAFGLPGLISTKAIDTRADEYKLLETQLKNRSKPD